MKPPQLSVLVLHLHRESELCVDSRECTDDTFRHLYMAPALCSCSENKPCLPLWGANIAPLHPSPFLFFCFMFWFMAELNEAFFFPPKNSKNNFKQSSLSCRNGHLPYKKTDYMPNTEGYILHILTYPIYNCGSSLLLHYSLLTHHAQHGSLFFLFVGGNKCISISQRLNLLMPLPEPL